MTQKASIPLTPKLRFPEFRDAPAWDAEKLGAISQIITDRAGTNNCVPMSITTGVGLVSQEEKFGRTIHGDSYKNYYRLQADDFAYNKSATKEFPQGYIAKYERTEPGAVPNSIFTCFRPDTKKIVPDYLDYLFASNLHGKWLHKFITVGARAHGALAVTDDDLMAMPIPLPPSDDTLAEQQKIADCLGSLDDFIAAAGRKLAALRDHKRGLMQQLFPQPGKTQPRLRFPEFQKAGKWEQKALKTVAHYENGKAYEKDIVEDGKYVVVNSRFISTDGEVRKYSNEEYCIAQQGDVLMVLSDLPNGKALAKCFLVPTGDKYAVNQRVCRLDPYGVEGAFLYYIINRHHNLMIFDDRMTQTHLSKPNVCDCMLSIPVNRTEQQKIAACLTALDTQITAQAAQLDTLHQHKRGLMQQLFPSPE